jgi:hypothetical protein
VSIEETEKLLNNSKISLNIRFSENLIFQMIKKFTSQMAKIFQQPANSKVATSDDNKDIFER